MTAHFSFDGGANWIPLDKHLLVCYVGADVQDGEPLDLVLAITADELTTCLVNEAGVAVSTGTYTVNQLIGDLP